LTPDLSTHVSMDNVKANSYLEELLNKKLRVYTSDSRMFLGDFKCTDNVTQRPEIVWREV